jgi:hypothetical protein
MKLKTVLHHLLMGAGSILIPAAQARAVPQAPQSLGFYFQQAGSYLQYALSTAKSEPHAAAISREKAADLTGERS